ncbi:MAG: hypothetical protein K2X87_00675 [Gemmataceae bacterium]|nr:hypothetical protein [Gemmataceae bacterium]
MTMPTTPPRTARPPAPGAASAVLAGLAIASAGVVTLVLGDYAYGISLLVVVGLVALIVRTGMSEYKRPRK